MIHLSRRVRGTYTFLLCFLAVGMPNLNLLMSLATILLLLLWLFVPGVKLGWKAFKRNKLALLLAGLFLIHVVWLFNTSDFVYALKDLRIKLPLLVFALVLGSVPITRRQLKYFFLALSVGVWIATFSAYIRYFNLPDHLHDYREIVQGISHIRLSLLMVVLVASVIYFWKEISISWKIYGVLIIANTFLFFNVLQSATGFIILIFTLWFALAYYLWSKPLKYRLAFWGSSLLVLILIGFFSDQYYRDYFEPNTVDPKLEKTTARGNPYEHHTDARLIENGNYTFNYISRAEMEKAWNARSSLKINSDSARRKLGSTLIRYLTSKGLRKDAAGVAQLTDADIKNIENGYPNTVYANESGLAMRFHSFLFGWHVYQTTGDAAGLSFFQRLVFWRVAEDIIVNNFWLGTGTGDVKQAFYDTHSRLNPDLDKRYWLRAHNQFLTFFASFGIFGFLYFPSLFAIAFYRRRADYLSIAFLTIAFLSCLTEDTVETQAGVTFFAVLFALLSKPAEPDAGSMPISDLPGFERNTSQTR